MNRRHLLQNLALTSLGILTVPAWAQAWSPKNLGYNPLNLSAFDINNLDLLAETIIPETDTPGAKTLEIGKFISKMIADTYNKTDQDKFKAGLQKIDEVCKVAFDTNFENARKEQKLHLLEGMKISASENQKWFYNTLKGLSVWAYTSSEYFMTTVDKFEFAPARYHGCVALTQ